MRLFPPHLLLCFCYGEDSFYDSVRIKGHALDSLSHQKLRKCGVIRWALSANADVFFSAQACVNHVFYELLDGRIILIRNSIYNSRIAIESQRKLCKVIRADGHAVENVQKFVSENRIGGNFAHHDYWNENLRLILVQEIRVKARLVHRL